VHDGGSTPRQIALTWPAGPRERLLRIWWGDRAFAAFRKVRYGKVTPEAT